MSKKMFLCALWLGVLMPAARAQQWLGLANSNYAGINGVYLNPSSIADSRYGFQLNLVAVQGSLTNNYYRYKGPYSLARMAIGQFEAPYDLRPEAYSEIGGTRPKIFDIRTELRLPSFLISLGPRHSIAFSNRMRGSFEANNVTSFIANDFRDNNLTLLSILSNESRFRQNTNIFRETGLTYAREIWVKEKHYLKGGLTLKYLQGVYSSSLYSDNLQAQLTAVNGRPTLRLLDANIGYHYTQPRDYPDPTEREFTDALLWQTRNGRGLGADIGFTYEYRPETDKYRYTMDGRTELENQNKYRYRIGLSLLDIGRIRYRTDYADTNAAGAFVIQRRNADLPQQALANASLDNYYPILNQGLGVGPADRQDAIRAKLPTMLHLNFDYRIREKLYVNAAWMQSLRTRRALGMRQRSLLAITPRFETKHFEFSLPLTLINDYRQVAVGAMVRLGSFLFVGSDNLPGLFNLGRPFGMDVYAGVTISALRGKKKDSDNDGVSDKMDECPYVSGVWAFKGCPDTDGDGVEDKTDKCPTEAGSKELGGCPDRDGDKIIDSQDKCPDLSGPAKTGGCPDSDDDGVIDPDDDCPLLKGPVALRGCPDSDDDGIPDKDDRCPNLKGQSRYNGCPDTDGDNIPDPDDKCPDQAGTTRFDGCPDRDGDAVPDKDDRCPDIYGSPQNGGCPPDAKAAEPTRVEISLTQQEQKVLAEAFENLEFETGKSVIKLGSYESLDDLAGLLKERTVYRLLVSGHTDNVGNAANNLKLSKARADAVKRYLVRKGVGTDQLITEGFGSRRPIADNKTAEGRQRNRRVEMKVIK